MIADALSLMRAIEKARDSRVLLLAVSQLELGLLPTLYETLEEIGPQPRLDVILFCLGGIPNAARRIAMLLHDAADRLTFVVSDRCESSGTLLVTSGHEIVAGPVAIFTPIDPLLSVEGPAGEGPAGVAAEDVRRLPEAMSDWFGLDPETARREALTLLSGAIFPPTLTSFHRAVREIETIAAMLSMLGAASGDPDKAARMVDVLVHGFHSHGFALAREDLAAIGFPVVADAMVERAAFRIIQRLRPVIDPQQRQDRHVPHSDAVIATTTGWMTRQREPHTGALRWIAETPQ